jgi:hypothetical protein
MFTVATLLCKYLLVEDESTESDPEIETTLRERNRAALDAYESLCSKCDRGALNLHFGMLMDPDFQRRDTWETATGGLNRDDLRAISCHADRLRHSIEKLRRTSFIAALVVEGRLHPEDLLHPSLSLESRFNGLSNLASFAETIGPRARPDVNQTIDELVKYVHQSTGSPNYGKLEIIFEALNIPVNNLKQRQYDRSRKSPTR